MEVYSKGYTYRSALAVLMIVHPEKKCFRRRRDPIRPPTILSEFAISVYPLRRMVAIQHEYTNLMITQWKRGRGLAAKMKLLSERQVHRSLMTFLHITVVTWEPLYSLYTQHRARNAINS